MGEAGALGRSQVNDRSPVLFAVFTSIKLHVRVRRAEFGLWFLKLIADN